jgi:hypothetical protein
MITSNMFRYTCNIFKENTKPILKHPIATANLLFIGSLVGGSFVVEINNE